MRSRPREPLAEQSAMLKCPGCFICLAYLAYLDMKEYYSKPPLTIEEQARLLEARGLVIDDYEKLLSFLCNVSYYRISSYLFSFKDANDKYAVGTKLDDVYKRYTFDRRFRLLLFDGIERVETAIKSRICNVFTMMHGVFGYLDNSCFNNFPPAGFARFLNDIDNSLAKCHEYFIEHYRTKYSNEVFPLWMVMEVIAYGTMFTMFRYMNREEQFEIARQFALPIRILKSWLHSLNYVRNVCAHHDRLWNRWLAIAPSLLHGTGYGEWKDIDPHKPFAIMLILSHLLRYCAPRTHWRQRMEDLVDEYADLPFDRIGFPENWKNHPVWKQ